MYGTYEFREHVENVISTYAEWQDGLGHVTADRVDKYMRRLEQGNFGDANRLQGGVFELRMDFGPGYRAYYGREGRTILILLGAGSKRRQEADIAAAVERWKRYKQSRK